MKNVRDVYSSQAISWLFYIDSHKLNAFEIEKYYFLLLILMLWEHSNILLLCQSVAQSL